MDPKEFFNIKTFLSSPIKRKSSSMHQKNDPRPNYSQTSKSRAQKISSIFNRTFFISMQNTQKGSTNIKPTPKCQTQQTVIVEQKDNRYKDKKPDAKQRLQQQKIIRQNTEPNNNYSSLQGVKTRSLTFEYYYKKIKRQQKCQKRQITTPQPSERRSSLSISKQYTTNLNHKMLESMKKYIKKGEKVVEIHGKYSGDNTPHYGLDIKAIETKKSQYIDEELLSIKEIKRYSLSSLIIAKKPYRPMKEEIVGKNHSKDRRVLILEKMLCKNRNGKTETSPQKLQIHAQKSDEKTLITRLQGMTVNLNLILNSFKSIWVKQLPSSYVSLKTLKKTQKQKPQKYTYFIGYGNNKHLIRSIMKKRWWWTEVHNINEANFIWTQLKVNDLLDQMEKVCKDRKQGKEKYQNETIKQEDAEGEEVDENEKSTLETLSTVQICLKKKQKNLSNQYLTHLLKKQNLPKLNMLFHCQTPIQTLYHPHHPSHNPFNFTLITPPKTVHNHFRLNYMFGNKNALFHNLKGHFEFMKDEERLYGFMPKTYYLERENRQGVNEFYQREFVAVQKDGKAKGKGIWIVKPAQNSNRGQGISVHSTLQSIKKQISSSKKGSKFIVQSYLRNLFLYKKRKFDIRCYLLLIRIGQSTKYFWYNEGYIRTSSEYYNTNDIENIYIHLTNDAIQCDSEKYGKFEPGNKLSYSQFQRYLDTNYTKERYEVEQLNERMKEVATEAVRAIHPKVKAHNVQYSFELFGLDFLIDSTFNPWLLQINTNPCLQLACPVLQRLIPRMLQNMFRLCLDPVFQPHSQVSKASSYFIYDNLFDINRFELVFDSMYDENKEYVEWCEKQEEKVYADEDEVFENDGQEVDVGEV